jgi:tetratricopeptide (TPR) repeat protein
LGERVVAERAEEPESEAAESGGAAALSPAGALAIGVRRGRRKAGADPKMDAFLDEQTELARLQKEHLHEQRELILSRLRWGRFSDRMKALLQVMTSLVGLAVVALVAAMAWQAHEARGLVIDAFSVPPDLARGGLTGEVVAGRFLDKLQAMQKATAQSDRPAQSFQDNWGSEIKVEIPETGLTFGEFEKLLRDKLGRVRHVSGELLKTPSGIALTARIGDEPPETFTGAEGDFDALAQKAAESVYRSSQPYRYAEYLDAHGRVDEATAAVADLAQNGPPNERGWAYAKWAMMDINDHGDVAAAHVHAGRGLGFTPGSDLRARISLVNAAIWLGDEETDLRVSRMLEREVQKRLPDTSSFFFMENRLLGTAWLQFILPDYRGAAATWLQTANEDRPFETVADGMAATAYALSHDPGAARRIVATTPARDETSYMGLVADGAFTALPVYWIAAETGDWAAALADARRIDDWLEANRSHRPIYGLMQNVWIWPLEAMAEAKSGDRASAEALIGKTPLGCYLCLRVRGQIATMAGDRVSAERWFAEAVRQAPSPPFAYAEWGRARLDLGDPDGAIAELALARGKGPRFADPAETWGEALMRKGDYAGAATRFAEADKDAPNWGQNHLMWGEALMLAGRYPAARAQFGRANDLELSRPDRAALNVLLERTANGPLHDG